MERTSWDASSEWRSPDPELQVVEVDVVAREEDSVEAAAAVDMVEVDVVAAATEIPATGKVEVVAVVEVDMEEEEEEVVEDLVVRMMALRADGIKKELSRLLLGPCRPFAI
jgi:hypothetical protein